MNEILPIPDAQLRAWERAAGARSERRALDDVERDDRRWWWAAVLLLLALETWMRRSARVTEKRPTTYEEAARVA